MSRRKKAAKAAKSIPFNPADVANVVTANPYIQRLIEDADLRDNLREAVDSSRSVLDRVTNGKTTIKSLVEDKKLHKELRHAADTIRAVSDGLTESSAKRKAKKGFRFGRVVMLGAVGGAVALATNEGLRSKVLDMLFGAEEEFDYTPPAGASPAPAPSAAPVSAA